MVIADRGESGGIEGMARTEGKGRIRRKCRGGGGGWMVGQGGGAPADQVESEGGCFDVGSHTDAV